MKAAVKQRYSPVIYFAYGSNMKTSRLKKIVPSAKPIGRGRLNGKKFAFNKKSVDGSGKANLLHQPGATVWGVLYELDPRDLPELDKVEGGYQRRRFRVVSEEGRLVMAQSYISHKVSTAPRPYNWYKRLVLDGAKEHRLPQDYIRFLKRIPTKRDRS